MSNPYMNRIAKTCHGTKSEQNVAKRLGGKLRPASGALLGAKGDVSIGGMLLEAKSTIHGSLAVKLDWLLKISNEAVSESKMPALSISFVNASGKAKHNGEWVMVRGNDFKELLEAYNETN